MVLKAVSGGYDGRGVWICDDAFAAGEVLAHGIALLAEEYVPFRRGAGRAGGPVAAPAGRGLPGGGNRAAGRGLPRGAGACPGAVRQAVAEDAQRLALSIADALGVTGLLAVELFEAGGGLLVNELAMRPHNSGHWTIEGARTSQFEQHLRAVLDLPLGAPQPAAGQTVMVNVFGDQDPDLYDKYIHVMAADPGVKVHIYGKAVRPGRKIGHVTVTGSGAGEENVLAMRDRALRAASYLATGKERARVSSVAGDGGPLVGVVMGSDSDWPVMEAAGVALAEFGVPYEADVVSAHRMPHEMIQYGSAAAGRGLRVIIAGAGGAAHLPGMLAAVTPLPVIGVPVPLRHLDGLDSLLSIVQMPAGVPVATVAVGAARNAGLLAVRILGAGDPALRDRMAEFQQGLRQAAQAKGAALRDRLGGAADPELPSGNEL